MSSHYIFLIVDGSALAGRLVRSRRSEAGSARNTIEYGAATWTRPPRLSKPRHVATRDGVVDDSRANDGSNCISARRRGARSARRAGLDVAARLALGLVAVGALLGSAQAAGADPGTDSSAFKPAIDALIKLFVTALLLESGLNALFTWRVYLALLDGRGWKTVIMVATSWLLVETAHIDWLAKLIGDYNGQAVDNNLGMRLLTALILAGGSNGIYNILLRLGYRTPVSVETVQPKPPPNKAWVSVTVVRKRAVGPIMIVLQPTDPAPPALPPAIAGVVGSEGWVGAVWGLFFHDRMRFPPSAGHPVDPGVAYTLAVKACDSNNQPIACPIDDTYVFALGAIVDLRTTL